MSPQLDRNGGAASLFLMVLQFVILGNKDEEQIVQELRDIVGNGGKETPRARSEKGKHRDHQTPR